MCILWHADRLEISWENIQMALHRGECLTEQELICLLIFSWGGRGRTEAKPGSEGSRLERGHSRAFALLQGARRHRTWWPCPSPLTSSTAQSYSKGEGKHPDLMLPAPVSCLIVPSSANALCTLILGSSQHWRIHRQNPKQILLSIKTTHGSVIHCPDNWKLTVITSFESNF